VPPIECKGRKWRKSDTAAGRCAGGTYADGGPDGAASIGAAARRTQKFAKGAAREGVKNKWCHDGKSKGKKVGSSDPLQKAHRPDARYGKSM